MVAQDEKIKSLSEKEAEKLLGKETFRTRINEIICEHLNSVDFMKKVREYAGMEIDSRMFTSFRYWSTIILTAILTSGIGILIGQYFTRKQ